MADARFELAEINTWRWLNKNVSQRDVMAMVESWEGHGYRFGCVCVDDGWTEGGKLGDWTPDPVRFPDFTGLVDWIHRKGYAVRLWVAPAQMHKDTRIWREIAPDGVLKNRHGEPAFYAGLGTYRLDTRTPRAQAHIREVMQRLIRDYRVDAFKVDFPPFYRAGDEFYVDQQFAFSDSDNRTMVPAFYRLVRESIDSANAAVRIECAQDLPDCEAYVNDVISGDLVGCDRSLQALSAIATRLKRYAGNRAMVPWLEMVWGEGSDRPNASPEWYAGLLECVAVSINFGLKVEHSFWPFEYPNAAQIRAMTNLYGPRRKDLKVLCAGRKCWTVAELADAGVEMDAGTNFLVAPEETRTVALHTGRLGTNALQWQARDVLSGTRVPLRVRNEFWGGSLDWCCVEFEARGRAVYELWHEGTPDDYFRRLYETSVERPVSA
jgi:hypothetical protein